MMNSIKFYTSRTWAWVLVGGLLVSLAISFGLIWLQINKIIPAHNTAWDLVTPAALWFIICIILVRVRGSEEDRKIQSFSVSGLLISLAFFMAFIGGWLSYLFQNWPALAVVMIGSLLISFYALGRARGLAVKHNITVSWGLIALTVGGMVIFTAAAGVLDFFGYLEIYSAVAVVLVPTFILYRVFKKRFIKNMDIATSEFHYQLSWNILGFLTVIFVNLLLVVLLILTLYDVISPLARSIIPQ